MRPLWKIFIFFTWVGCRSPITMRPFLKNLWDRPLQWDHFEKSLRSPITMRPLWEIFLFFTSTGHPLQWDHFEKSLYFLPGQVSHYNETILKNICIFHLDIQWDHFEKSLHFSSGQVTHYNETIWKNLCILHLGGHPWQFDQFKNLWILPTDRLSGTTIPPQKKNLSILYKDHPFLYKPNLFFIALSSPYLSDSALFSPISSLIFHVPFPTLNY